MKCVKVTVYHSEDNVNKVSAIKMWRTITGAGLKESKDFIDTLFGRGYNGRVAVILSMAQLGELLIAPSEDLNQSGLRYLDVARYEKSPVIDFSDIPQ